MIAPDRVAFSLFGLDVMWYGLLIGLGFMLATAISYARAYRRGIDPDFILDLVIFMIPTAIIGARAYYVLFSWDQYAGDWAKILDIRSGGLAIHGGLIACFTVAYFICRHKKISFLKTTDLIAPTIPLAQSIGRWGNFFNEEAHGGPTDLPWAQIIDGVGYHPTFLYESIWCFGLFWLLSWIDKYHRKFDGQVICLYGILYSVERFFVESLRTDSLMIGPLRQAQVISLTIIAGCAALYYILNRKHNNEKETL
jgi:phosphatidylglycerol:prolipoprotein diacylglycerol transferase